MDRKNSREWYWALMDYGVMLKKKYGNANVRSRHYKRQSRFYNSHRQLRGMVIKLLSENTHLYERELMRKVPRQPQRIRRALNELCREGFIVKENNFISLA
jgi:A/G-specific adenine glycosylase